ncbi:hypothetical protein [Carboxylicivirga sp. M1479]|uniref:hypothetical protein n=1 Tax=Carboxylicivirga sp. M1479 TaxID=2594476 RepID=UPI0011776999|nr:hypothetical protein [Carboxylicivirga sp. M1479]TRX66065.1 hypothetical protein FNN09_15330 [Carboxylicivirga sp. M1479]
MIKRLYFFKKLIYTTAILSLFSCESEYDKDMDDKLEGYKDIPTDVKLTYDINADNPSYVVDYTATGEGQIYFALKKDVNELDPETSTDGVFAIKYDNAGVYKAVLIAQGLKGTANDTVEVVVDEKIPFELLASVEVSNDGSGKIKFNMEAQNATSYQVDIFENDGTTLIFSDVTDATSYSYLFLNEELVEVTKECLVTISAKNNAGVITETLPFSVTIAAGVAPPKTWGFFDDMDGSACGDINWNAVSDETGLLALSELPAAVQANNSSATLRYHYKANGAQYGVLEFSKLADGSEFDFSFQAKFRVNVYIPSSTTAPDGNVIDNTDNSDKKIIRLYLEDRYRADGSSYSDSYKRNVWIEKEVSAYDQWETIEFDFTNQSEYKYHSQAYGSYKYYIPDGKEGQNPDRLYLRTHVNGNASESTIYYFDDFELLDIDGSSLGFVCPAE